jgi:hypothetical protein
MKIEKGAQISEKGPKQSINRGGQLIFTIAIWEITKWSKTPFLKT